MSHDLYEGPARIAAALASPARLHALNLLLQSPRSIEALAQELDESEANTAAHMKVLRNAGLVRADRRGKYVFQEVHDDIGAQLFLSLRDAAEQLSPQLFRETPHTSGLQPQELAPLLSSRNLLVVDLRPAQEFARGHLPHARSIPFTALEARVSELPERRRILAYCRGKYCPTAAQGVSLLREAGRKAERLRFGVVEWRASGLPLESEVAA